MAEVESAITLIPNQVTTPIDRIEIVVKKKSPLIETRRLTNKYYDFNLHSNLVPTFQSGVAVADVDCFFSHCNDTKNFKYKAT